MFGWHGAASRVTDSALRQSVISETRTTRGRPVPKHPGVPAAHWRAALAGPAVAGATMLAALVATHQAGVPLRDPKGVAVARFAATCAVVAAMLVVGWVIRRLRRGPGRAYQRWTAPGAAAAAAALTSFYVNYLAYRNLKSVVPALRPGVLYDRQLLDLDRTLTAGTDPAALLHSALGTNVAAHFLSAIYMLFFVFIPVAVAAGLVLHTCDRAGGLFLVCALSLNWTLGAVSYFLLPSIGPFHAHPAIFAGLPATPVSQLQNRLVAERAAFLARPSAPGASQSIGAFASLHMAIYFTAAFGAHLLGLGKSLKVALWTLTGLTGVATVYFGWHYLSDDAAGAVIAGLSLVIAQRLTGWKPAAVGERRGTPAPTRAAT